MIRCARRKLRYRAATSRSCRNSFEKRALSSRSQAMVSVIAVSIQLSSPSGVLRSDASPGILRAMSSGRPSEKGWCMMYDLTAMSIGVVKQEVKRSPGRRGLVGRTSSDAQAASCM